MKTILTVWLLLIYKAVSAQTIKGMVIDSGQQAVPGAVVCLIDRIDTMSTVSNEKGLFSLQIKRAGLYQLQITAIGFSKLIVASLIIKKDTDLGVLPLKSETQALALVTIKGTTPLVDRQLDKTVVNVAQNLNNEGSTVLEVMQRLPGVQMTAEGQVSMSGRSGVNVFIDGKPTYLSAQDLVALLGSMPASEVQRIELMSNPSSKYDAAGTSGIINIVKKRSRKAGFNGSVNASAGQGYYGKYNGGITLNYKTENYNLLVSNTYVYNKTFSNRMVASDILNADQRLLTEEVSSTDGINTSRNYRPTLGLDLFLSKKTTLSFSGTAGFGSSGNRLFSHLDILDSLHNKIGHDDFSSQLKDNPFNYTAGLQLSRQLDTAGRSFTINADHSEYRNFPLQNNLNTTSEGNALLVQHRQLDIYSAKADYVQPLNKGKLEAGIKSSYVKVNNDNSYYNQTSGQSALDLLLSDYSMNTEQINAAYLNLNRSWQKLTLQAGMRAEQTIAHGKQLLTGEAVDQNYLQFFPTLFAAYKADDQNAFTARLGRRIERPAYNEMVTFRRPQTATLFFEGNPNLKPQVAYHAELSLVLRDALFVTVGYDLDRDYIQTFPYLDSNKVTITRRPTNVQGAHSWNIDLSYSKKLAGWWSTDNTLSLYQNAFNGQAAGYSLNNPGIASIYLSSNNSFPIFAGLSAEADLEYNSKRQLVNSTFGAYNILSIGLRQQLLQNKASLSLNARNILNSEGHNAIDRNSGLYQYSYFNFYTRSITLSFNYRFGNGKSSKVKMDSGSAEEQKRAAN
jgi:outer membrane receptor protein involved in Fe transport